MSRAAARELKRTNRAYLCSRPAESKSAHEDCGVVVKFSASNQQIVASVGRPNVTLKVTHIKSDIPQLMAPLKLFGGLDWHHRLPYVCAADDTKLCFWRVLLK